jgi:hypothetical protein
MVTKPKHSKVAQRFKTPLILTGFGLTLGWALIVAIAGLQIDPLSCTISPYNCSQGAELARIIIFGPVAIGSLAMPVGIVLYERWSMTTKVLIVVVIGVALYFVSFWTIAFMLVAFHGLGG